MEHKTNVADDIRELIRTLEMRERRQRSALDSTVRQLASVRAIALQPPEPTPLEQEIERGQKKPPR